MIIVAAFWFIIPKDPEDTSAPATGSPPSESQSQTPVRPDQSSDFDKQTTQSQSPTPVNPDQAIDSEEQTAQFQRPATVEPDQASSFTEQTVDIPSPMPVQPNQSGDITGREAPELEAIVTDVVSSNRSGIENVLHIAEAGNTYEIEAAARDAGRAFSFSGYIISRDRRRARALNNSALEALKVHNDAEELYRIQRQVFQADRLDLEIAGNLAIYAFRSGRTAEAQNLALYALSLPRENAKTGRSSDWVTLGATYAALGSPQKARATLYVTVGIAPDMAKRCYSAVYAARNTYGSVLKDATEAMFVRIREQGLSSATECAWPIQW